jgi:hypothetical protein
MKKPIFVLFISLIVSSCGSEFYVKEVPTQTTGLDFSNGKWLLGNIEVDSDIKDELTEMVLKDFSNHLNDRIKNSLDDKSLLVATSVPLNPSKSVISDLRKGTNYDYFINIKCYDQRSYSNKDLIESTYYTKQMTFGLVQLEVYDLNAGAIVYSQRVRGSYDEHSGVSSKPARKLILGAYQKIIKEINIKS